jgi:hypothetical protein
MTRFTVARIAAICLAIALEAAGDPAHAQKLYRKSPDYDLPLLIAQLPKYCYAQYYDAKLSRDPRYSIIAACGVGSNHFCPGLMNLMRAEYTINPKKFDRRYEVRAAKENVIYTLVRISSSCPYRQDILAAKNRAEILEKIVH